MTQRKYPPLLVIVGTTTSGKSDLAVKLAQQIRGEIISADSRQIYRSLNQTTGKITEKEMGGVPHHMLDILDPGKMYNAHRFAEESIAHIENIYKRKNIPIIAGGTGFYIDTILFEGTTAKVPADLSFRKEKRGVDIKDLQQELQKKDPEAYKRIDNKNPRRLIRTLEIIREIGVFPLQKRIKRYEYHMVGIKHSRTHLREKIVQRLENRFEDMRQEIQSLLSQGIKKEWFEQMGLECKHIAIMLTEKVPEEHTKKNLAKAIFAYAKRQETWLRRYPEITWYREDQISNIHTDIKNIYNKKGS